MLLPSTLSAGIGQCPRPRLQRFAAYSHDGDSQSFTPMYDAVTPQGVDGTCTALQMALGIPQTKPMIEHCARLIGDQPARESARCEGQPVSAAGTTRRKRTFEDIFANDSPLVPAVESAMALGDPIDRIAAHHLQEVVPMTPKRRRFHSPTWTFCTKESSSALMNTCIDRIEAPYMVSQECDSTQDLNLIDAQFDLLVDGESLPSSELEDRACANQTNDQVMSTETPSLELARLVISPIECRPPD